MKVYMSVINSRDLKQSQFVLSLLKHQFISVKCKYCKKPLNVWWKSNCTCRQLPLHHWFPQWNPSPFPHRRTSRSLFAAGFRFPRSLNCWNGENNGRLSEGWSDESFYRKNVEDCSLCKAVYVTADAHESPVTASHLRTRTSKLSFAAANEQTNLWAWWTKPH